MIEEAAPQEAGFGSLIDEWGIPPFTVLDTRQGYWQERRRRWLSLGIQSELGRDAAAFAVAEMQDGTVVGASGAVRKRGGVPNAVGGDLMGPLRRSLAGEEGAQSKGTSIFDPVLCEVVYRWWCPPGGLILDPFAGGSVRGIVAARMGHPYVGIDLSARQVDANRKQAADLLRPTDSIPVWIVGDSLHLSEHVKDLQADLVFTCPPYYDLEVYSDDPADLSAMPNYAEFLRVYRLIIEAAVSRLADGGFAVFVVSEMRGADGTYLGFVPDTIAALNDAGAAYYNEGILVNSAGSLPLRVGQYMKASRKLGRSHQNVIVGRKGAGSTRAWDYQREQAPDPQIALWDLA